MTTPEREGQLRRRALLLPTPLRWLDPDGEAARVRTLVERFDLGPDPDPVEQSRLEIAATDADDALLGGLTIDPPVWRQGRRGESLRHPLSGRPLATPDPEQARIHYARWLDSAGADIGPSRPDADRLWWSIADSEVGHRLPAHPALPDVPAWARRSLTLALFTARAPRRDGTPGEATLLQLHIGPVKRFIEAARRTHDLWLGSYLLAHLGCHLIEAVARATAAGPAAVVYPFVARLPLLRRWIRGEQLGGDARIDLLRAVNPNKLLAIVADQDADDIARRAVGAAQQAWIHFGDEVDRRLTKLKDTSGISTPVWTAPGFAQQMAQHLEFDAWIEPWPTDRKAFSDLLLATHGRHELLPPAPPMSDDPRRIGAGYGLLFDVVHRSLGAARNMETPPPHTGDHRPKCGQCGVREQMGPIAARPHRQQHETGAFWSRLSLAHQRSRGDGIDDRLSLQLGAGEGLCAVCLTKRMAPEYVLGQSSDPKARLGLDWGDTDRVLLRFPSVASIATAPFRARIVDDDIAKRWAQRVERIERKDLGFTPPGNQLPGLGGLGRASPLLAIDGTWLYRDSYDAPEQLVRDYFDTDERRAATLANPSFLPALADAAALYTQMVEPLVAPGITARPSKYYAVVKMDGDDFGQWVTGTHARRPLMTDVSPGWIRDAIEAEHADAEANSQADTAAYYARWLGRGPEPFRRPLSPALHGEFSRRLAVAGTEIVPDVIEERGLGRLVFSGGDDMLALLPLETTLHAISRLVDQLREATALGDRVTFSGGVAVGHIRDPLTRAVRRANDGESAAKHVRRRLIEAAQDALGNARSPSDRTDAQAMLDDLQDTGWLHVALHPHSGDAITALLPARLPRASAAEPAAERLDLVALLEGLVASRDDEGRPLFSTAPVHRFNAEAAALAGLPDALAIRLRTLVRRTVAHGKSGEPLLDDLARLISGLARLRALVPDGSLDEAVAAHRAIPNLLLLARFLAREVPANTQHFLEGRKLARRKSR